MCCSSQSCPGPKLVKLVVGALLWYSASVYFQPCLADPSSLPVVPQAIEWLSGPVEAPLAGGARIRVPASYRFTDAKGARILLESAHAPIPAGLAGLMTPVNGDWWITFDYSDSGHVAVTDQDHLDQDALLKTFWVQTTRERKAFGLPALTHVNWEIQPSYHPSRQFLDYAIRMEGFSAQDQKLTYVARFLGRRGVIQARSVVSWKDRNDAMGFREAVGGVSFKEGSRYADFQNGDKSAPGALAELITSDKGVTQASVGHYQMPGGMMVFWFGLFAGGCVGITGIVIIAKKIRKQKPAPASAPAPLRPAAAKHDSVPNGYNNFKFNMKLRPTMRAANGNGNGNGNGHGNGHANANKRRRMFNYEKFYTEMVLQGPTPVIGEPTNGFNGYNGYDSENQQSSGSGNPGVEAHSQLISHQKALIEEQKRLIHEQARLIEEKSKLISEKNQLLDRQSQMLDNNLL